jgi:hypothetical protein
LHLTEAQAGEVRHRLAKINRRTVPFDEAFKRFHSRKA